jgi:hypothetical protein
MRLVPIAGVLIAGLALLPAMASPNPITFGRPAARPPYVQPHGFIPPTGCTSDVSTSFIGIPSGGDVAGSNYSAVVGGFKNEACDFLDVVGGGEANVIGSLADNFAAQQSFLGAGAKNAITSTNSFIGAGESNGVSGASAFIGAGEENFATGQESFVGAGIINSASGVDSFVGAGGENTAQGGNSGIGAGVRNTVVGGLSFVGAGVSNDVTGNGSAIVAGDYDEYLACKCNTFVANQISGDDSFIGAGDQNTVNAKQAFVGAGQLNEITSAATNGVVSGGYKNVVAGKYATIPGGGYNEASGDYGLAAGYHADAANNGSFVWSDYSSGSGLVKDTAANQFVVRASGGTYVYSSENLGSGVRLAAGSGTWSSLSDRNAKTDIVPLDDAAILVKVTRLPLSAWRYKTETRVRHVGPMAQDFYAAFGVGEDDRHITSIDEDGIALAAIKALHTENAGLRAQNAALAERLAAVERAVKTLTTASRRN